MGYSQLVVILVTLAYGWSLASAGLSQNQTEIERAAELAVERAAERAAERAVEKALNSGNSSTVTVTVKESYSNAKKTAEEAAAPGSESTRPYDPQVYDRQYAYRPPGQYDVEESAEAEELGISKESLNSSVEDLGAAAEEEEEPEVSNESADLSFESARGSGDKPSTPTFASKPLDTSSLDVSADFSGFDVSGELKGDFGLKSNTKTFSQSYSSPKNSFVGATVDVDDDEGAEILKMYTGDFGGSGWASSKQQGWIRHKPLWDDTKSRISRSFWDDFGDNVAGGTEREEENRTRSYRDEAELDDVEEKDERRRLPMHRAVLTLNPKGLEGYKGREMQTPGKMLVAIPMPYLSAQGFQASHMAKIINNKFYAPDVTSEKFNDETMEEDASKIRDLSTEKSDVINTYMPMNDQWNPRSNYETTTPKPIILTTKKHSKRFNAKYSILKS